jgi:DNA-binding response OmpR family regulator
MFSSSGRPDDRDLAMKLGAQDYVQKPVSGMEFREVLRRLSERWLSPPASGGATPAGPG